MASKEVYSAMEAGDWNKVKELIRTFSWTPQDLEEKHGVLVADPPVYDRIYNLIVFENICICSLFFHL